MVHSKSLFVITDKVGNVFLRVPLTKNYCNVKITIG
jgi:hypothetical protein